MTTTSNNRPYDSVHLGAVEGAIWRHVSDKGYARYGVTFQRFYKHPETGQTEYSNSFNRNELLILSKVADMANTRIYELQAQDRDRDSGDEPGGAASASDPNESASVAKEAVA